MPQFEHKCRIFNLTHVHVSAIVLFAHTRDAIKLLVGTITIQFATNCNNQLIPLVFLSCQAIGEGLDMTNEDFVRMHHSATKQAADRKPQRLTSGMFLMFDVFRYILSCSLLRPPNVAGP